MTVPFRDATVDFNVDDSRGDMLALLRRIRPIAEDPGAGPWAIDARSTGYLGPDAAAVLGALCEHGRRSGHAAHVFLPTSPDALRAFCVFSGLSLLMAAGPAPTPDHPENETVPLTFIDRITWNTADPVVHLVQRHATLDIEAEERLRTCLNETLQNIEDHARSPIGGVLCARFLRGRRQIRVAVADTGIGVGASLRARHPSILNDPAALRAVMAGGMTARSRPNNLGVGISTMWRIAAGNGGSFTLISNGACAYVDAGNFFPRVEPTGIAFPGTVVLCTLTV
jgi:hypothetical protein